MNGGYVSGIINFNQSQDLYIYIGEAGKQGYESFNANIRQNLESQTAGGATDIRLTKSENWYDFASLKSRIMVAAGAGSGERFCGGDGGGLVGLSSKNTYYSTTTTGGTQTSGGSYGCQTNSPYHCGTSGKFGIGGTGAIPDDWGPSGGGGYYGGGGIAFAGVGSGGSCFVSGYEGCNAIAENSTEGKFFHTGKPIHYSGLYFNDILMLNGQQVVSLKVSKGSKGEQSSHGYAIITPLDCFVCSCILKHGFNVQLCFLFISFTLLSNE